MRRWRETGWQEGAMVSHVGWLVYGTVEGGLSDLEAASLYSTILGDSSKRNTEFILELLFVLIQS
jgi:hypothetical protein